MSNAEIDVQRQRAARNQSLFRDVNERMDSLNTRFAGTGATPGYVCECHDSACAEMIAMPHEEYERIRRDPHEFFVVPGHEDLLVEEIVDKTDRWFVVRKIGVAGTEAEQLAPPR